MAFVNALFQWNNTMFVAATGGIVHSNLPATSTTTGGFGGHSMVWLSCILTFFAMNKIFAITREKLVQYVGKGASFMYDTTKKDVKTTWNIAKDVTKTFKKVKGYINK